MNKYYALVLALDDNIEEEVTLSVVGYEITCFAGICPYEIYVGKKYPVLFNFEIFNSYKVEELENESVGFERIGDTFAYWIKGRLDIDRGVIDCGIRFEDEFLLPDYGYLDGKFIRLKVDRIDVEFLEE